MFRISVINHTDGEVSDKRLQEVIRAVNTQIERDFRPYWHRGGQLRLEGHEHTSRNERHQDMRGDAVLYLWNELDPDGALGFHDLNARGIPFGMVFLQMSKDLDEPWTVTFSHEVLELLLDPEANLLAAGPHPKDPGRTVFHWYEVCDAVQKQKYEIDGVEVSNFVLPLYFTPGDEAAGRNDFLGTLTEGEPLASFGVADGGYVGFYDPELGEHGDHDTHFAQTGDGKRRSDCKAKAELTRRSVRYRTLAGESGPAGPPAYSTRRAFKVEGPWNIGQPVHEVLTLLALKGAIASIGSKRGSLLQSVAADELPEWSSRSDHNLWTNRLDRSVQQFVRGVIWPDDPEGLFFDEPIWMEDFSNGLAWNARFERSMANDANNLIARSHYGDLQFFHGMAMGPKIEARDTRRRMLKWARGLIEIATARLPVTTLVRDAPTLKKLFRHDDYQDWTIKQLFGSGSKRPHALHVRQRATGALLHMVQDSCAAGHVARESDTFEILQFLNYGEQDAHEHSKHDKWGKGATLADHIANTGGASQAVQFSIRLVAMLDQGRPQKVVLDYLRKVVWPLAPNPKVSGAGDGLH